MHDVSHHWSLPPFSIRFLFAYHNRRQKQRVKTKRKSCRAEGRERLLGLLWGVLVLSSHDRQCEYFTSSYHRSPIANHRGQVPVQDRRCSAPSSCSQIACACWYSSSASELRPWLAASSARPTRKRLGLLSWGFLEDRDGSAMQDLGLGKAGLEKRGFCQVIQTIG
jgi:hypothetical protein